MVIHNLLKLLRIGLAPQRQCVHSTFFPSDCWELEKPDGFDSVDSWVDGLREFHTNDVKPHSKSKIINLENHKLQIELTTNTEGYLWKLFPQKN